MIWWNTDGLLDVYKENISCFFVYLFNSWSILGSLFGFSGFSFSIIIVAMSECQEKNLCHFLFCKVYVLFQFSILILIQPAQEQPGLVA